MVEAQKQKVLSDGLANKEFYDLLVDLIADKKSRAQSVFDSQPKPDSSYEISHGKVLAINELLADLKRLQGEAANANADDGVVR